MSEGAEDEGQEKSHAPTQRRLDQSREKGDVAYSTEITMAATYGALFLAVTIGAGAMALDLAGVLAAFLRQPDALAEAFLAPDSRDALGAVAGRTVLAAAPLFIALAVAAAVSLAAQRAVVFAPDKIKPKLSRLSIIDNAKQKYGPNGIGEFVKSVVKIAAVTIILTVGFRDRFFDLPFLARLPVEAFGPTMYRESVFFLGLTTVTAIAIAAVDLPWKLHRHEKKLMMSFEDLKKESKETEGDPGMKGERRRRAQEIATNRMLADVPTASVVIVNPTHYAVALRWERDRDATPVCVAKGVDEVAARIRAVASENGVPIRRDPPTARSIHALVDIGKEIRKEHYAAVAAAIHYADEIKRKVRARGSV